MATLVLTWNPDVPSPWPGGTLAQDARDTAKGRKVAFNWAVGGRRHGITPGDRCFMFRQGKLRGLVASGRIGPEGIFLGPHWDPSRIDDAAFVNVEWDRVLAEADIVPVEELMAVSGSFSWNTLYQSGRTLPPDVAEAIENLWARRTQTAGKPGPALPSADLDERAAEGELLAANHLRRERDRTLRQKKIDSVRRSGCPISCEVCGFDFERVFGAEGRDVIDVHHVLPLHISGPRTTALSDLALVCPNCHRMLHTLLPWVTVRQLRNRLGRRSQSEKPGDLRP